MKISLLRTLVAAFALCMAVPGQAAMAGDVGSGGEPGVQQEVDTGVRFYATPNAVEYERIGNYEDWGRVGRANIFFGMDNYSTDLYVRIQLGNTDGKASVALRNPSTDNEDAISLDSDNGCWIPSEYIENGGSSSSWFNATIMYPEENTLSYTVSVYSSKNLAEPYSVSLRSLACTCMASMMQCEVKYK